MWVNIEKENVLSLKKYMFVQVCLFFWGNSLRLLGAAGRLAAAAASFGCFLRTAVSPPPPLPMYLGVVRTLGWLAGCIALAAVAGRPPGFVAFCVGLRFFSGVGSLVNW